MRDLWVAVYRWTVYTFVYIYIYMHIYIIYIYIHILMYTHPSTHTCCVCCYIYMHIHTYIYMKSMFVYTIDDMRLSYTSMFQVLNTLCNMINNIDINIIFCKMSTYLRMYICFYISTYETQVYTNDYTV